jgi:hypothetical protein
MQPKQALTWSFCNFHIEEGIPGAGDGIGDVDVGTCPDAEGDDPRIGDPGRERLDPIMQRTLLDCAVVVVVVFATSLARSRSAGEYDKRPLHAVLRSSTRPGLWCLACEWWSKRACEGSLTKSKPPRRT